MKGGGEIGKKTFRRQTIFLVLSFEHLSDNTEGQNKKKKLKKQDIATFCDRLIPGENRFLFKKKRGRVLLVRVALLLLQQLVLRVFFFFFFFVFFCVFSAIALLFSLFCFLFYVFFFLFVHQKHR